MANERDYKPIGIAHLLPTGGLLRNSASAEFALGTEMRDNRGNVFRYIKASEALVEGDTLTAVAEAVWDTTTVVDGAGAAADTKIHVDTNTSAWTLNQYAGYYIRIAAAASIGKAYRIKSHSAIDASSECDVQLDDKLSEVMANNGVLRIFHPYLYEKTDAATEAIKGVAVGAITSAYFGWVQVGGFFQAIKLGHSTSAATVLDEPLVPVAANAGAVQGMAGNAEGDIMESAASGLLALSTASANVTGFITGYSKGVL